MKNKFFYSLLLATTLFASEKIAIPLPAESLSIENSGTKQPIDAYQDGVGIYALESLGANKVDNSEMNALVFKYGDAAKELNISVKEYVQTNGSNSEKELASTVGKFEPMAPGNGTACNDNNMQTINDIYTNGVCAGTNVEGQSCNDNNTQTINDKYVNGVCVGTVITDGMSCDDGNVKTVYDKYTNGVCAGSFVGNNTYFLSPTGSNNGVCSYDQPCKDLTGVPLGSVVVLKNGTYSGYYIKQAGWRTAPNVLKLNVADAKGMKIIGENKNGVLIDYRIGSVSERDRNLLFNIYNMSIMNLKINYSSNSSNSYSSAIVAWSYNIRFDNVNINTVSGIYSYNYENNCPANANPVYNKVTFTGSRVSNYSCGQTINATSPYTEGSFLNYL